jgi:hypothetical protein
MINCYTAAERLGKPTRSRVETGQRPQGAAP